MWTLIGTWSVNDGDDILGMKGTWDWEVIGTWDWEWWRRDIRSSKIANLSGWVWWGRFSRKMMAGADWTESGLRIEQKNSVDLSESLLWVTYWYFLHSWVSIDPSVRWTALLCRCVLFPSVLPPHFRICNQFAQSMPLLEDLSSIHARGRPLLDARHPSVRPPSSQKPFQYCSINRKM